TPCFALVRASGDCFELAFSAAMRGEAQSGGRSLALAELAAEARVEPPHPGGFLWGLPDDAAVPLPPGATPPLVRSVRAPRRYPVPLRLDRGLASCLGATGAAWAVFLALVFPLPPDAHSLSLDGRPDLARTVRYTLKPADHPEATLESLGLNKA